MSGPLAPPTRRARLRSRWRSRYGGASAGRLARIPWNLGRLDIQQLPGSAAKVECPCSRCQYCPGRAEPVKSAFGVAMRSSFARLLTEPARHPGVRSYGERGKRLAKVDGPAGDPNAATLLVRAHRRATILTLTSGTVIFVLLTISLATLRSHQNSHAPGASNSANPAPIGTVSPQPPVRSAPASSAPSASSATAPASVAAPVTAPATVPPVTAAAPQPPAWPQEATAVGALLSGVGAVGALIVTRRDGGNRPADPVPTASKPTPATPRTKAAQNPPRRKRRR